MGKRSKSRKGDKGGLYYRTFLFLFGVFLVAGSAILVRELFIDYAETGSTWFYLVFAVIAVFMFAWGVVTIVSCFLSENSRLRRAVEAADFGGGANIDGIVFLLVLAAPVYFLLKFIRRMSYEDDSD